MSVRSHFREKVCERDGHECIVPWCDSEVTPNPSGPGEQHHVVERKLWEADHDGYLVDNGVAICNQHHQKAEECDIPPQAFWAWIGVDEPPLPAGIDTTDVNKWGEPLETPPHDDLRTYPKYPSTKHMFPLYWQSSKGTAAQRTDRDDTGHQSVEQFLDTPLVVTAKMDGSNAMLVADGHQPVRARNGRHADHVSFDNLKNEYWKRNVYSKLPDRYQVFGEDMYAKHSIHYGCNGGDGCDERNQGPSLSDDFLVFGVYDTELNYWLSWSKTDEVARMIGFDTVPVIDHTMFQKESILTSVLTEMAERQVSANRHEGIVVRPAYPIHYGNYTEKLGKYVRPNHVQTDEHWTRGPVVENHIRSKGVK